MARTDNDSWDLASSVGATATMVAAGRARAHRAALIDDPFAEPLVRAVGIDFFTRWAVGELDTADVDIPGAPWGMQRMTDTLTARTRYIDRQPESAARASDPWRHPQARQSSEQPKAGGRFVDHEFFDDRPGEENELPMRRGARVRHDRFGEGQVLRIDRAGEPAVVAFFPGWGEKKILARFLKLA